MVLLAFSDISESTTPASILESSPKSAILDSTQVWLDFTPGPWKYHAQHGNWYTQYAGAVHINGGCASCDLVLQPPSVTQLSATHAGLVTSTLSFDNVSMSETITTVKQVRVPVPNPWEVGWFLWHFRNDHHFYYLVLKPNGWELGKKVDDPVGQKYLLAGSTPRFPIGKHTVDVLQAGPTIQVFADGHLLGTYVDRDAPYLSGSIGLYAADAEVRFGVVAAKDLP